MAIKFNNSDYDFLVHNPLVFGFFAVGANEGPVEPPPVIVNFMITQDDDYMITQDGDFMITQS